MYKEWSCCCDGTHRTDTLAQSSSHRACRGELDGWSVKHWLLTPHARRRWHSAVLAPTPCQMSRRVGPAVARARNAHALRMQGLKYHVSYTDTPGQSTTRNAHRASDRPPSKTPHTVCAPQQRPSLPCSNRRAAQDSGRQQAHRGLCAPAGCSGWYRCAWCCTRRPLVDACVLSAAADGCTRTPTPHTSQHVRTRVCAAGVQRCKCAAAECGWPTWRHQKGGVWGVCPNTLRQAARAVWPPARSLCSSQPTGRCPGPYNQNLTPSCVHTAVTAMSPAGD